MVCACHTFGLFPMANTNHMLPKIRMQASVETAGRSKGEIKGLLEDQRVRSKGSWRIKG